MAAQTPILVLLPGLGADGRLFDPQRKQFAELVSPPWLEPTRRESLSSYAERMAEQVRGSVPRNRELILGGVSFGGMLAAEMSRVLKPRALVLIGSALGPGEIAQSLKMMAAAGRWMPSALGDRSRVMGRAFIRTLGPMRREHRVFLESMIDAVPFSFMKWAADAMFSWQGVTPECPLVRIHGSRDRIIPISPSGVTHIVRGAGHVPNVSHADEVNAFLAAVVGKA